MTAATRSARAAVVDCRPTVVGVSGADRSCLAPFRRVEKRPLRRPPYADGVGWGLPVAGEPTVHRWGSSIVVRVLIADADPARLRGRFTASSVTRLKGRGDTTCPHRCATEFAEPSTSKRPLDGTNLGDQVTRGGVGEMSLTSAVFRRSAYSFVVCERRCDVRQHARRRTVPLVKRREEPTGTHTCRRPYAGPTLRPAGGRRPKIHTNENRSLDCISLG